MLWTGTALLLGFAGLGAGEVRADTVASLLGNFTINQYCGLTLTRGAADVHYAVVFGQLPALRELHLADTNGDGVTSQAERDAYVGQLAPGLAEGLKLEVAGVPLPLRVTHWASSLPTEQGGFSLRVDVDLSAVLPAIPPGGRRRLQFINQNYSGLVGWHEIVVQAGDEGIRFLLVSGKPLEEPVAWYGPIVMNTQQQLEQAMAELRNGTFIK